MDSNVRLEVLSPHHAAPLQRFERANRSFFAARVGDRGDDYFEHFDDRLAGLLHDILEGRTLCFVVVDDEGEVLGRVNISSVDQPELTEVGFRVGAAVQGRRIATDGVRNALDIATRRGVMAVTARVSATNTASRRVLEHCGFRRTGPVRGPAGSAETFLGYHKSLRGTC